MASTHRIWVKTRICTDTYIISKCSIHFVQYIVFCFLNLTWEDDQGLKCFTSIAYLSTRDILANHDITIYTDMIWFTCLFVLANILLRLNCHHDLYKHEMFTCISFLVNISFLLGQWQDDFSRIHYKLKISKDKLFNIITGLMICNVGFLWNSRKGRSRNTLLTYSFYVHLFT